MAKLTPRKKALQARKRVSDSRCRGNETPSRPSSPVAKRLFSEDGAPCSSTNRPVQAKKVEQDVFLHTENDFAIRSARTIMLGANRVKKMTDHLNEVIGRYKNSSECVCVHGASGNLRTKRTRYSDGKKRCQGECNNGACRGAQCVQNASAFVAAADYIAKNKCWKRKKLPKLNKAPTNRCHKSSFLKCASAEANHRVDYYDSGLLGDYSCPHCAAKLLPGHEKKFRTRETTCCSNGAVHTEKMRQQYDELQNPPREFLNLACGKNQKDREAFLSNTRTLNNAFAFASTHSEKAPLDQVGGRGDCCKYNGNFSFTFSDLFAPNNELPKFAQVYTLSPEDAINLREENISKTIGKKVGADILKRLEEVMREHPFAKTFMTAAEQHEAAKEDYNGEVPNFQIVLLSNRSMNDDAILNADGTKAVVERADAPTAKQIAVIWISDEGLAPKTQGFYLADQKGKMRPIKHGMPQLDPACFPLLRPRGTPGWRWFMEKEEKKSIKSKVGAIRMETDLCEAQLEEVADFVTQRPEEDEEENALYNSDEDNDENGRLYDEDLGDFETLSETDEMPQNIGEDDRLEDDTAALNDLYAEQELDKDEPEVSDHAAEQVTVQLGDDDAAVNFEVDDNEELDINEPQTSDQAARQKTVSQRTNISARQFARYEMAWRDGCRGCFHWLWFARRLAEFFVISITNRVERSEMDFVRKKQKEMNLRKMLASEYLAAIEKGLVRDRGLGAKLGQVYLMPRTFAGSRQYYQEKYADLMTICRRLGNPTWFVTFTGNPRWPEIQACLQKGQSYAHRADIVCEIFMDKATEFIRDVCKRNVLGDVGGWCFSVEHQKRGMPHIHLLLILKQKARIVVPADVDQYISARVPYLPEPEDMSIEAKQQRRLWHLVTTAMLHDCNKACKGPALDEQCNKYFPKQFSKETILSADRYAQYTRLQPVGDPQTISPATDPEHQAQALYRRIQPSNVQQNIKNYSKEGLIHWQHKKGRVVGYPLDDSRVISHNPYLLLKFGCHINVEFVFGQKACKYIFKYLLKGFEKGYVRVHQPAVGGEDGAGMTYNYDEISATFAVRYMTSMEAYLRLVSYPIVSMKHQIYSLSVHDDKGQTIVVEEGHEEKGLQKVEQHTRLTAFFDLCNRDGRARCFRYDQLPYYYWWNQAQRKWLPRKHVKEIHPESTNMFVRVYSVMPTRKELFAIRLLLLNRPGPRSFEDLKTVRRKVCTSYTEAAEKLGLLESDSIFVGAMADACSQYSSSIQLHRYFAMLVYHSQPQNPQALFDRFLDDLFPAPAVNDPQREPLSVEYRRGQVMKNLEYFFRNLGKDCKTMGLTGLPPDYDHEEHAAEIEGHMLEDQFYGRDINKKNRPNPQRFALNQIARLNNDQRTAFDTIASALTSCVGDRLFFIEGAGGTGKTFLYNVLIRWCLAGKPTPGRHHLESFEQLEKESVISSATTGIAALLLIGASTVHSKFYIPNEIDENTTSKVGFESAGAEKFRSAKLIIIDEVSMMNRDIFNYIDRMLRDLSSSNDPFGGKCIVLGGDWRQLTPVVPGEGKEGQVRASIKMDPLFSRFQTLKLEENMRTAPEQEKLRGWLHDVGRGFDRGSPSSKLEVPRELLAKDLNESIEFCFPPELFEDPLQNEDTICGASLLCPRNDDVQRINDIAIERMQGESVTHTSIDTPLDVDESVGGFRTDFNLEAVNNEIPSGFPPYKLTMKIGAPVMLLRNLDIPYGLCNGTRLQILQINENLGCRILSGPREGEMVLIPPIKFEYGREKKQRGLKFVRFQFPIKLCFAMTINKAQGQTLRRMAMILDCHQAFSHGQTYVALSRVTEFGAIRILAPSRGMHTPIRNVVYRELVAGSIPQFLLPATTPPRLNETHDRNMHIADEVSSDSEQSVC